MDLPFPKKLVVPQYESSVMECWDSQCKKALPTCEKFYWISLGEDKVRYSCLQCSPGFSPITEGVLGSHLLELFRSDSQVYLCRLEEQTSRRVAGTSWEDQFPGCEDATIQNVQYDDFGVLVADFTCDDCLDDFEPVETSSRMPVFDKLAPKYLCRPRITGEVGEPKKCEGKCRQILSNCEEYLSVYESPLDPTTVEIQYKCAKCAPGFVSTGNWTQSVRFDEAPAFDVCEHLPTASPVPCGPECKENFPSCDEIHIKRDEYGEDIYHCTRCEAGFFPANYEDEAKGYISSVNNQLRVQTKVYLCARDENIIIYKKVDCKDKTQVLTSVESAICASANCLVYGETFNLKTTERGLECLECKTGYSGSWHERLFDRRWELCQSSI